MEYLTEQYDNARKTRGNKSQLKKDCVDYRSRPKDATRKNIRYKEQSGLAHGKRGGVDDGRQFTCYAEFGGEVNADGWWASEDCPISDLSKVERLTEIQYLSGVKRMTGLKSQPLGEHPEDEGDWNIGKYNYGEGIYIGIKPKWLEEQVPEMVSGYDFDKIDGRAIHQELDFSNKLTKKFFPCLHTLSHLLIKEICLESGYSLDSITERLYLKCDEAEIISAGILLYTTGSSSDGTLGGLSSQAKRKIIEKIMKTVLQKKNECSNDPICGDHRPKKEEANGSACHACVLLPETCCEVGNQLLDRNWEVVKHG